MTVAQRSQEHYFLRGDLVLQIEGVLFKLHQDILETHSGFFRNILLVRRHNITEETTDENPLHLPQDICSAKTFEKLCKFIYVKEAGVVPSVTVRGLDVWEPVLEATVALDMTGVEKCILDQLAADTSNISSEAVKLLSWAKRGAHEALQLECFRRLAHRRRPMSHTEMATLGIHVTAQVMYVRERFRTLLLATDDLLPDIQLHNRCTQRSTCAKKIFDEIVSNLHDSPRDLPEQDSSDVFNIKVPSGLCSSCKPKAVELAGSLKNGWLDGTLKQGIKSANSLYVDK